MKRMVLFGHRGALGRAIAAEFVKNGWKGYGVSPRLHPTENPVYSPLGQPRDSGIISVQSVDQIPSSEPVNAVICVAGAFEMNNTELDALKQLSKLWAANVEPSLQATELFLKRNASTLVLTGARTVHESGTPFARAYGMCKAAVHHLALSTAADESIAKGKRVACILPTMLDTPMNRQSMPNADFRKWTPVESVAKTVLRLCNGEEVQQYDRSKVFLPV